MMGVALCRARGFRKRTGIAREWRDIQTSLGYLADCVRI